MLNDPVRILLVDDDEDDCLLVRDLFEDISGTQFELDCAGTCEEALDAIARQSYHAFLLDYYLGEQTGMDLLRMLTAKGCSTPIIILTGLGDREVDLAAMKAGATDYLVKSQITADVLERSIRYAIAQSEVQDALRKAHNGLEHRVSERTAELVKINALLQQEVAERKRAEAALKQAHDDLEKRVQDRTVALRVINELLQLEVEQRKQSEQAARESEARHRALLDAIPDAMIAIRREGLVLECKIPPEGVLYEVSDQLPNRSLLEVLPSAFAERIMEHVERAFQDEGTQVFDSLYPFGEEGRHIEVRVAVSGADETLCILRDITERKRAEQLKNEFLSIVSHELRTPMTSISGSLALMAAGLAGELPEQARVMIEIAHRNGERLVRLINDLLDLQKIESGTVPLHLEPVEMVALIEQAAEANYAYGARYDVTFVLDDACVKEGWVHGDADRLMQVLTNLLSNAAKFSPAGSTVVLSVSHRDGDVRVTVADQGPGIPEAYHEHIFQRFAQVDASSSRHAEGTGLGLSISKALVEMHGGEIDFETEPGEGSTFFFELPVWEGEPTKERLRDPRPGAAGNRNAAPQPSVRSLRT